MLKYFTDKLTDIVERIKRLEQSIIKDITERPINEVLKQIEKLRDLREQHSLFGKDATLYLSVIEFIALYDKGLIREYDAAYVFQYDKFITLSEREILLRHSYKFKDARVK